jgi:ABC-type multidrug transport system fused ATPase/permease subunit
MFGKVSGNVSESTHSKSHNSWEAPVRMIAVGVIAAFFRFIQVAGLQIFASNISHKIKIEYFKAVLGKDATWFDSNNPNEIATKIVKETTMIYRGIGDKIGELYNTLFMLLTGYTIAFFISWELTLIIMGATPGVLVAGGIMIKSGMAGVKEEMIAYQQCAGLAEQSL